MRRTYGCVTSLVVNMYKGPFDVRKDLYFILQLLTEIVRFPQGRVGIHNDIHFDKIILENIV